MDSNLIWMQNFHRPEYIPMLVDQYQKVLTDNAEKLEEKNFVVLVKRPNWNSKIKPIRHLQSIGSQQTAKHWQKWYLLLYS